jgi:hypothetical protein
MAKLNYLGSKKTMIESEEIQQKVKASEFMVYMSVGYYF